MGTLSLSWSSPAQAQFNWNLDRYNDLIDEAAGIEREASELPPVAQQRRLELLNRGARARLLAREMLLSALASGQVDQFRAQAVEEYFNLSENLVVIMLQLDQCEAASLFLDQLLSEPDLLPRGAAEYSHSLSAGIEQCVERVSARTPDWDAERFFELSLEVSAWRALAEEMPTRESRREPLFESVRAAEERIWLLRSAILSRGQLDALEAPQQVLINAYPPLIEELVELGYCEAAERRLAQRNLDASLLSLSLEEPLQRQAESNVERCAPEDVYTICSPPEPDPWPYILLFTSVAAGATALVVDLSLIETRRDLAELRAACDGGEPCDLQSVFDLSDSIDQSKWVMRGMAATSILSGVIGLVLLLTRDEEVSQSQRVSHRIEPMLGNQLIGASFSWFH